MRSRIDILKFPGQVYALSLRKTLWLDDECPRFTLGLALKVRLELMIFHGQHPSEREEVILLWKPLPHAHESSSQQILASEVIHAGEVIDLLVEFHLGECLGLDCIIGPADIPIHGVGRGLSAPSEVLGDLADYWILAV